jgi:ATP-dependent RNA helicase RhlE
MNLKVAVIFGGVGYRPQTDALNRGLDVLVATPGRLLDHIGERNADLRSTEVLVLDEADQMLDLGFIKPIRQIVSGMPANRQNLLFSATMPREISGLADQLLTNPVKVAVTPVSSTVERVAQKVIHIDQSRKRALLAELMGDPDLKRALVFTRTKRGADRVARHLETHGVKVAAIHGNKSQRQREIALDDFRDGKIRVLVATDIAARGIDVDQVSHVVNFELPEVPEAYVHRIGRTARAGASGIAISLCAGDERDLLRAIERTTRQTIASEDRRGDTSLEADKPGPRGDGDRERSASDRGGRSRGPGGGGQGRGRSDQGNHRGDRRPRSDSRPSERDRASSDRGSGVGSGDTTASLSNVGFLSRSGSGRGSDQGGPGQHRGRDGGSRPEARRGDSRPDGRQGDNRDPARKRQRRSGGRPGGARASSPAN